MAEFDPFALSSGLLDDADVEVDDATFKYDPNYNDGNTCVLALSISSDDEDVDSDTELLFPCGDAWEPADGGESTVRTDEKAKPFNKRSGIGLLLGSFFESGAEADLRASGHTPMQADMYRKMKFHVGRKEVDYGTDIGKIDRIVCTEWYGYAGEGSSKSSGTSKKAAGGSKKAAGTKKASKKAAAKPPEEETTDDGPFGLPQGVYDQMAGIADECEEHDEFMERCLAEIEGIEDNEAWQEAMTNTGDDSLWMEAVERATA